MITLEDRLAIGELIARFAHYSDYGDWAGLETLYIPEIVTELDAMPIRYEGIAAQVEHAQESDVQTNGKNRHFHYNLFIEDSGDAVIAHYYMTNVNAGAKPMEAQTVVTGRQRDTVVKVGNDWKFAHRYVTFDQSFDLNF